MGDNSNHRISAAIRSIEQRQEVFVEEGISALAHSFLRLHRHIARLILQLGSYLTPLLALEIAKVLFHQNAQLSNFRYILRRFGAALW